MKSFERIVESISAACFVSNGTRFLYVNPAFEHFTGFRKDELLSIDPGTLLACDMPQPTDIEPALKGGKGWQIEIKLHTKDSREKYAALTLTSIDCSHVPAALGTLIDITRYKHTEENLRRSEARYRAAFEFAPDLIMIHDSEGTALDVNPEGLKMLGASSREEAGKLGPMHTWSEEDKARFRQIREDTFRQGKWRGELKACRMNGETFDIETHVKVAHLQRETLVIAISRDISERKRMEEQIRSALREKEMLLREVHHRVKNNLQVISTLLKLQLRDEDDARARAFFRESQNRILSMAMIHEKIYQTEGLHKIRLKDYIRDLAQEIYDSFGENTERIGMRVDVEDIAFGMDTVIPCGLIFIELISNSLKYAFPDGRRGEIFIGVRRRKNGRIDLSVRDDGVGLPEEIEIKKLHSLGLRLVSDLARYQLKGTREIERKHGTTVRITFREKEDSQGGEHA